jgi:tight adherence protein C
MGALGLSIFSFGIIFVWVASALLFAFYRESTHLRVFEVINPKPKSRSIRSAIQQTGMSLGGVVEHLENVLPKSQAEVSAILQRLIRAGFRKESAVRIFYGSKVLVPMVLFAAVFLLGLGNYVNPFFVYVGALGLGFLVPDFWLGRQITKRQGSIRRGLPDVLDLLVICIEAGLGLDQATARTTEELRNAQPEICDELGIVVLEQRAGRPRSEAWKHLADRTGVDSVRNLVSMLVQSEQFGTSIAKTLRVQSDTLRTQRVQTVEEMAAKTTVKIVFPLVLFIFPSIFLVTLGPAVISMIESFKGINH